MANDIHCRSKDAKKKNIHFHQSLDEDDDYCSHRSMPRDTSHRKKSNHRPRRSGSDCHVRGHERASHTSVYFTPEPDYDNSNLRRDCKVKHRTKRLGIHIKSLKHRTVESVPRYSKNGPQYYDPLARSEGNPGSSSGTPSSGEVNQHSRRKIIIYDPVKRSCSQESAGRYASQFKNRLEEDKKCNDVKIKVTKSPRKGQPVRKKVYRPKSTQDSALQTNCAEPLRVHKECQATEEFRIKVTTCNRGDQCELLEDKGFRGCEDDTMRMDGSFDNKGHAFPFIGTSASGNLKVAPEMISFENKKVSVLVADPRRTRVRHKEWHASKETGGYNERQERDEYRPGRINECRVPQRSPRPCSKPQTSRDCKNNRGRSKTPKSQQHQRAPCQKYGLNEDTGPFKSKPNDDSSRNYAQEMKAWASKFPLFKSEQQVPDLSQRKGSTPKNLELFTEKPENNLGDKKQKSRSQKLGTLSADARQGWDTVQNLFKDLKPVSLTAPKIPPFPRETSPGSTIPLSQPYTTETDEEDSSYQSSNAKNLRMKGSRGTLDFMENLHYRVKRAIHPDTKVVIGQKEFPVHAVALQIHSKYFDNLTRPHEAVNKIELPESIVTPEDFQHVMDWVLTDEQDRRLILTRDNVVGLYATAQYLEIPQLRAQCLKFVQDKVDSEDPKLIKLWEDAHTKPKTKELIAILSQKLTNLFPKLYKTRQFLKLDVNEIVTLLDSDDVVIDSEMDIFDAAVRWLLYDWANRKRYTVKVMSTIRFGLLTPLQLTQMRYLSEDNDAPDFKRIFSFDSVKRMLDDGLTYAILKQSYGKRSSEMNKWVRNTGVTPPRPRVNLDPETPAQKIIPDALNELINDPTLGINAMKDRIKSIKENNADERSKERENNDHPKQLGIDNSNPAKDSLFFLPDIPYAEDPSKDSLAQKLSLELLDAEKRQNEIKSAVTVQRYVRGFLARKSVQKMRDAATTIQKALRAFRSRTRNDYRPIKEKPETKSLVAPTPSSLQPKLMQNLDIPKDALLIFGGTDPKNLAGIPDNTGQEIFMYTLDANLWMNVGKMPEPRTHFGIARIENDVFIVGGTDPRYKTSNERNIPVKSVWKVNLRSGEWSFDSDIPKDLASPKSHFGCVTKNGIIYVIGGNDVDSRPLSTCEKYDKTYNSWTSMAPLDGPRLSMGIAIYEDRIWVAGGISKNPKMPVLKSVLCYDITSNRFGLKRTFPLGQVGCKLYSTYKNYSWTAVRSLQFPRAFFGLVNVKNKLYLIGGAGQRDKRMNKATSLPDILVFDKNKEKWNEVGLLTTARHGHSITSVGNNIIVLGGVNSSQMGAISSVEVFDVTTSNIHKGRSLFQKISGMGVIPLS